MSVSVTIYNASTGTTPLRWRGTCQPQNLRFTTQIPGGFAECSFSVSGAAAQQFKIDTGQKVIVREGKRIIWFGWIEDIARQQGARSSLAVMCLGPWQNCMQRLVEHFTGGMDTDEAIKVLLLLYCDRISANFNNISASGVEFAIEDRQYSAVADIINDACSAGNSSDQPMLFAIWEPDETCLEPGTPYNLLVNGSFEQEGGGGETTAEGWTWSPLPTSLRREDINVIRGFWSARFVGGGAHATTTDFIEVVALTDYVFSMKFTFRLETEGDPCSAGGALNGIDFAWYDDDDVLLSTTSYVGFPDTPPPYTIPYVTCVWQEFIVIITAPAGATQLKVDLEGWAWTAIDDLQLYPLQVLNTGSEAKPIPHFWAQDLSDYEYCAYTARSGAPWTLTETTRDLANSVWVSYGGDYTAAGQDSASQAAYRRRDVVVSADVADESSAEQIRDTYLAKYKDPTVETSGSQSFGTAQISLVDKHAKPVRLTLVRAGQRIKIMDGPYAGSVITINKTEWQNGVLSVTPEKYADMSQILARSIVS